MPCYTTGRTEERGRLRLQEYRGAENTLVSKEGRRHYSEVALLLKREPHRNPPVSVSGECGEWAYFKLYGSAGLIDQVLITRLLKIIRRLKKYLLKWFFVRYEDSAGHHLRLRFLLKDITAGAILDILQKELKEEIAFYRFYRIVPELYYPETERYKDSEWAEEVFYRDSERTLKLVRSLLNPERMEAAVQTIAAYLDEMEAEAKERFCERQRDALLREQPDPKQALKSMNRFFRDFEHTNHPGHFPLKFRKILKDRKPEETVLASLIHMSMNRLFIQDQRALEMLAYHILFRRLRAWKSRI